MKKSTLEKIRQEIERDQAAQSEPERLARSRAEKLLGPRGPAGEKKRKEIDMER